MSTCGCNLYAPACYGSHHLLLYRAAQTAMKAPPRMVGRRARQVGEREVGCWRGQCWTCPAARGSVGLSGGLWGQWKRVDIYAFGILSVACNTCSLCMWQRNYRDSCESDDAYCGWRISHYDPTRHTVDSSIWSAGDSAKVSGISRQQNHPAR
jgi:hypothetical protein